MIRSRIQTNVCLNPDTNRDDLWLAYLVLPDGTTTCHVEGQVSHEAAVRSVEDRVRKILELVAREALGFA